MTDSSPRAEAKRWTSVELIRWTADYLKERGFAEPRLDAELLLAGSLGVRRLDLYLQFDRPLSAGELAEFKARLKRRLRHEPLQYIEGRAHFRELTLKVDRRVLIPRPETEVLVGEVLGWANERPGLEVLDVGTGSGAIALSLRKEGAFGRVVATDVSAGALEVARDNLAECCSGAEVEFRLGPLFSPVEGEQFDIIVSNPPYVGEDERESLPPEVREWEPAEALFAGEDGLAVIRRLVTEAGDHLRPGGLLALEIGASQAPEVAGMVRASSSYRQVMVRQDFAGRDRIVLAVTR